jgi:hypothetical protein
MAKPGGGLGRREAGEKDEKAKLSLLLSYGEGTGGICVAAEGSATEDRRGGIGRGSHQSRCGVDDTVNGQGKERGVDVSKVIVEHAISDGRFLSPAIYALVALPLLCKRDIRRPGVSRARNDVAGSMNDLSKHGAQRGLHLRAMSAGNDVTQKDQVCKRLH